MKEYRTRSDYVASITLPRLLRSAGTAVMVITTTSGCADVRRAPSPAESVALVAMDTLVTTASELIGGVYDLAVSPDGDVYVVDYGYKHVLVVGPDGTVRRTIGTQGSGPGEFEMPYVVHVGGHSIRVLDIQSNRVQVFDRSGEMVRSYRVDAPGLGGGRDLREDGSLAATIDGFDNAMFLVFDPAGTRVDKFGEPIVPPVTFYDFTALKSEIRDGRVPDAFRNRATPAWATDSSLYRALSC